MRLLLASFFLIGSVTAAAAQNAKCEVKVASDKFVADLNGKTGQFVGNVIVTQCDTKLRADQMRITTVNGQATTVTAVGRVVADSPKSGIVTGDNGVYDVQRRTVVMTGRVTLKNGKNVMTGPLLTVNLATGLATVDSRAAVAQGTAPQQPSSRVQAIFSPPAQGGSQSGGGQ